MEQITTYNGQQDLLSGVYEPQVEYAGFWLRFAAYTIDIFIIYFVAGVLILALRLQPEADQSTSGFMEYVFLLLFFGMIGYFPAMESSKMQATLGKRAVKIKVTDLYGNRISFGKALGRLISKIVSAMIFYIGFMMAGFTEKKQGLHDIIAGTLVVKGLGNR